jgi:hypothetical protein
MGDTPVGGQHCCALQRSDTPKTLADWKKTPDDTVPVVLMIWRL